MDLDMSGTDFSETEFTAKFDKIIKDCKNFNVNTLIVHARPFSDALYNSEIFPTSHILSGEQGKALPFDPLKYMISAAHRAGLKFHAWVNPMRVQLNNNPSFISPKNPFAVWKNSEDDRKKSFVVDYGVDKYYNPGYAEVRSLIIDGVKEIVANYDVDGVQFDDYFYPEGKSDFDTACYNEYLASVKDGEALPLGRWRMANVNSLIAGVYSAIKNIKPQVQFGISPACSTEKDAEVGADVCAWCQSKGYVDYICPQAYFNFEHPTWPFTKVVDTWKGLVKNENVKLYYGLGVYKTGSEEDDGTWKKSDDILQKQIEYARSSGCDGFMLFCYSSLKSPQSQPEVSNMMKIFSN